MTFSIHLIAAARPNFMKIAPLYHALKKERWANPIIIHTGQHYDLNMSDAFFNDFELPAPDIHLGIGSGTHAEQTGKVMMAYEKVLVKTKPDMVIVVGDVNSTLACTLATVKISYSNRQLATGNGQLMHRPVVAHLESGLRSFDRTMPEEINRIVTDSLADILWTPSRDADENLLREGVPKEKIIRVGNIMIDSLEMLRGKIEAQQAYKSFGLQRKSYALVTLHRPSNVDVPEKLGLLTRSLMQISREIPIVFPAHPRTRKNLVKTELIKKLEQNPDVILLEPLNYIRFMNLVFNCCIVITDSGGIQEETSYLGIPCLTIRPNTERPITITNGTNQLCGISDLAAKTKQVLQNAGGQAAQIEMWDGKTAQRVVNFIKTTFFDNQISSI